LAGAAVGLLALTACTKEITRRQLADPGPAGRGAGAGLAISVATALAIAVGAGLLVVTARSLGKVRGWGDSRWWPIACLSVVASIGWVASGFYVAAYGRAVDLAHDPGTSDSGFIEMRYTGPVTDAESVERAAAVFIWAAVGFAVLGAAATALVLLLGWGWRGGRASVLVLAPVLSLVSAVLAFAAYIRDPRPGIYESSLAGVPSSLVVRVPAAGWVPLAMIGVAAAGLLGGWMTLAATLPRVDELA